MKSQQKLVLWIAILASFVSFLDGSVVNVALPAITKDFAGDLSVQQWVVDAYAVTLGSLMLIAGSLSDLFGRQRILRYGLIGFGVTSLLCALAPNSELLIIARALQGVAGALLVPSSLALIIATHSGEAQAKAIGRWTAWTGISFIIGPLIGGLMVDAGSWRLIFAINVLPIVVVLWLLGKLELKDRRTDTPLDVWGAALCAVGLGAGVFALIEQPRLGWAHPAIFVPLILGLASLAGFVWREAQTKHPMLPLGLFRVRNFAVGNMATLMIYAALALATFVLTIFLQQVGQYTATLAGLSLIPVTIIMFFLSSRFGALSGRFGPRWFMAAGPVIAGLGFVSMSFVDRSVNYLAILPGILLFGLGLSVTVAPLTSAILGSIREAQSGIGSAVNNAVSRIAGLVAVAVIGTIAGKTIDLAGFHVSIIVIAALLFAGGLISAAGISNTAIKRADK